MFNRNGKLHPTQKPTALLEYLINTYSNEYGEWEYYTNRKFIGIELDEKYFRIAEERITEQESIKSNGW